MTQPVTTNLRLVAIAASAFLAASSHAAEPRTEHTFGLAEGETRPAATLGDAAMLVGSWEGEAFGSRFEETWNPPSAGSMVGLFKLYNDDGVAFYEIMLITVEDGTLSFKVKHFSADFTAWEEKEDYVEFKLVAIEEDALHFGGLSFYQRGPDAMDAYIVMRNDQGIREEKLVFRRRDP